MEVNGLGGGLFSAMNSGMLGLEMAIQQNPQTSQNPHHLQHPQMVAYAHHDPDQHLQAQPSLKHSAFSYSGAAKSKQVAVSDEDEPGFATEDGGGDGKRKMSPWQRMKWTDTMVRLLIMAVFYIGDEGGSEGGAEAGAKKKVAGGLLQKKGKWKSVSRAMMEKGFYVSPQQCEDKFNDLNKRYKRVNDILGKGTACRVVENQSLLDSMELAPKMKEEVRKLLNSKHLFFREMCAYHNSCGHGSGNAGGASGTHHSPEVAAEPSHVQTNQQAQQSQCFHSTTDNALVVSNLGRQENEESKMAKAGSGGEEEVEDDEDDDSGDYDDEDEDDHDHDHDHAQMGHDHDDDDDHYERRPRKRARKGAALSETSSSQLIRKFSGEVLGVIQDVSKSSWEKKQWLKMRMVQLEEQQVSYQYESFELEKQRLKWVKFSSKKERDMEKAKFENERKKLENERMVLLIRQKELEVFDLHHRQNPQQQQQQQQQQHSSNKRGCGDPSSITG